MFLERDPLRPYVLECGSVQGSVRYPGDACTSALPGTACGTSLLRRASADLTGLLSLTPHDPAPQPPSGRPTASTEDHRQTSDTGVGGLPGLHHEEMALLAAVAH